ncbi:MAG: BREX-1 system adenine-specific DNA-methyltransferase PglX [Prevotella sp.]
MDTNRIKRFATEARNKLKEGIAAKIRTLGFDKKGNVADEHRPQLMQGGTHWNGQLLPETFYHQWTSLYNRIRQKGISEVYEEAAYTWFNRLCAIRILQKNDLCAPVLDYTDAARTPFIVDEARQGRIPEMNDEMRSRLSDLLDDDTKVTEQFAVLINAWCHDNPIIYRCFGAMADYTELLLPNNILTEGGFVDMLNHTDFITEADYRSPELIGWLYQFYISERKDEVFAKKGKFEADEIPAATQIFTPNWIVKYMVQNTVGRIYLDNNPYETQLQKKWKYLVGGAVSHCTTSSYSSSQGCGETPHLLFSELTELKVADLACGSGHILNECFDLLYDLYIAEGYGRGEAIENIFRHNLTGVDLDTRAKQLATFALLLKACQKDAAFADGHCLPNVLDMEHLIPSHHENLYEFLSESISKASRTHLEALVRAFVIIKEAHDLGSIMKFDIDESTRQLMQESLNRWETEGAGECQELIPAFRLILALTEKYHALVMNPPYMGGGNMNATLAKYVKEEYEEGKADLFSVFMLLANDRLLPNGKYGMINMQSWMFLSSFEKLRTRLLEENIIDNMLHLGPRTFDELSGEVVQNTAFVITNTSGANTCSLPRKNLLPPEVAKKGTYYRLVDGKSCSEKEQLFLDHICGNEDGKKIYYPNVSQQDFEKIPGAPIGYWVSDKVKEIFTSNLALSAVASPCVGLQTADNARFLRLWFEVSQSRIGFGCENAAVAARSQKKWFPYNKGGSARKWYGNQELLVNWENDGQAIKEFKGAVIRNPSYYFRSSITWSLTSSVGNAFRYFPQGFIFDVNGMSLFTDNIGMLAYLNTKMCGKFLSIINPTLACQIGNVASLPFCHIDKTIENQLVQQNISISKQDWDAHETSWDFEENPLLAIGGAVSHCTTNSDSANSCCGGTPQLLKFVNKREYIHINGQQLPHWNQNDCVQFVTFRLADSLPQSKLMEYKQIKEEWLAAHPKPWDDATQEEYDRIIGTKIDKWLDAGYGSCILQDERIRKIVEDSILHFNGEKYNIHAYVIMPNHVHVLLSPIGDNQVQSIVGSWKKFSAHEINKMLNQTGSVWERESFDRMVRGNEDFEAKFKYIEANPQNLPSSSYTLCMGSCCGETPQILGGAVSHCTTDNDSADSCCGETPQLLLEDLMNAYKQKWEYLFMQLHANEEELNRQFIDIYGLQDELTPDVPLDEITILQQGEVSFNL